MTSETQETLQSFAKSIFQKYYVSYKNANERLNLPEIDFITQSQSRLYNEWEEDFFFYLNCSIFLCISNTPSQLQLLLLIWQLTSHISQLKADIWQLAATSSQLNFPAASSRLSCLYCLEIGRDVPSAVQKCALYSIQYTL